MSAVRQLQLPADLCAEADRVFGEKFGTLEELLIFLLRALVNQDAVKADQLEEHIVEQRLKELGYL